MDDPDFWICMALSPWQQEEDDEEHEAATNWWKKVIERNIRYLQVG